MADEIQQAIKDLNLDVSFDIENGYLVMDIKE